MQARRLTEGLTVAMLRAIWEGVGLLLGMALTLAME